MKKKVNRNPQLKFAEYAAKTTELEGLTAHINKEILAIKERYAEQLEQLKEEKQALFDEIQLWAMMNIKEFEKTKSQVHPFGVVGFRKGNRRLNDGIAWDEVCQHFEKNDYQQFLRKSTKPDKHAILKAMKDGPDKEMLEGLGLKIVQDETFYIDPSRVGER